MAIKAHAQNVTDRNASFIILTKKRKSYSQNTLVVAIMSPLAGITTLLENTLEITILLPPGRTPNPVGVKQKKHIQSQCLSSMRKLSKAHWVITLSTRYFFTFAKYLDMKRHKGSSINTVSVLLPFGMVLQYIGKLTSLEEPEEAR